jgi:signal transduction histidine kinase
MANPELPMPLFLELRKLAAENPRLARAQFSALLDSNADSLDEILRLAGGAGEGRLRQLIANAVKRRADKARVVPQLQIWLGGETDEFAKAAISAALAGVDQNVFQPQIPSDLPQIVETYRYVADRLCHRIRNSMTVPAQHLRTLEILLNGGTDTKSLEAKGAVTQLKDSLRALSRIVEFNIDDGYFEWRAVDLVAWLQSMTSQYIAKNTPLTLKITGLPEGQVARIRANDLLLEILFWNLWKNAQQAVGDPCEITAHVTLANTEVEVLITDNGSGFSAEHADLAFVEQFSSLGSNRGRGLLEVHDAIRRLGGTVDLVQSAMNEYRIRIRIPILK